jgi:2,3-bisphosphoglycerate-dependent phosphoglycerate mutase
VSLALFMIRHGQSFNNALAEQHLSTEPDWNTYLLRRSADPPLTELGKHQAKALGKYLRIAQQDHDTGSPTSERGDSYRFARVYCSPMLRALQTAQPVGDALGVAPEVWVEIHEHGGLFERDPDDDDEAIRSCSGLSRSEMKVLFPNYVLPPTVTEHGWWYQGREDMTGCYARAIDVAAELRKTAQTSGNERIALVSHGTFMDSLIKALLSQLPGQDFHFNFYNTAVTRLDISSDGHLSLRYSNRVSHLVREMLTR